MRVLQTKSVPTKRAPDAGDSGAIPSLFLRLIIFPVGRRSAARPSAGNANRWALRPAQLDHIVNFQKVPTVNSMGIS
jgi:hypothetical protein